MRKEIEKLCLSENQYRSLGLLMIALCVILCVMIYFCAEFSLLLAIVYAVIGLEFLMIGFSFRKFANEISLSEDREFLQRHQYSAKSRKNRNMIIAFCVTLFLLCIISFFTVSDFEITVSKKVESSSSVSTTVTENKTVEETVSKKVKEIEEEEYEDDHSVVYATKSGKRYHYSSSCAGENSFAITIEEASKHSLTPCKKCVK